MISEHDLYLGDKMNIKVEQQYTDWSYPQPIHNMVEAIGGGYWEAGDPTLYWPIFWPRSRGTYTTLTILCAGCGTNQAAYYAIRNPQWNVIGIDLSESSLHHQNFLKEKHNLHNLHLAKLDLNRVQDLGQNFDFITCTGVLHHLEDPDQGLRSLKSVLRPNGVLNLMVYGNSLRVGVYMLQEAFRSLNLGQSQSDVDLVKTVLRSLPQGHAARKYADAADDLKYDTGIVDTFLHPQDRAYSVRDVYSFTRNAGLEFINWLDSAVYSPHSLIPNSHPLWEKLCAIPKEEAEHVCDILLQSTGAHYWFAGHPEYVKSILIPFENEKILDCTIALRTGVEILTPANFTARTNAQCRRGKLHFEMDFRLAHLIALMGGKISVWAAVNQFPAKSIAISELFNLLNSHCRKLYELGHLYIVLPES